MGERVDRGEMNQSVREEDGGEMLGVFFFKQKTAYELPKRDWSSDVCSSDLDCSGENAAGTTRTAKG